jgi:drug/metabolite transporter (DMT)-like permease
MAVAVCATTGTMTNRQSSGSAVEAYVLLTLTALCWGANTVFGRLAVGQVSPMALVTVRWFSVSVLLLLFARRALSGDWAALRARMPFVCAMGAIGFTAFNALYYTAAHFTTAVNMGIVQGSMPVWVVVGSLAMDRTRVRRAQGVGVVISLLGVAVVALAGDPALLLTMAINPGDLLMVIACVLYAGYTVALRRGPEVSAFGLLTVMALAAFVASLPLTVAEWATGRLQWPTPQGWLIVLAIALFPSLLAQVWFIRSVRLIGPARSGMFVNLVPVFAAIMGVTLLSEPFEPFHAVALVMVLGGIWLSEHRV